MNAVVVRGESDPAVVIAAASGVSRDEWSRITATAAAVVESNRAKYQSINDAPAWVARGILRAQAVLGRGVGHAAAADLVYPLCVQGQVSLYISAKAAATAAIKAGCSVQIEHFGLDLLPEVGFPKFSDQHKIGARAILRRGGAEYRAEYLLSTATRAGLTKKRDGSPKATWGGNTAAMLAARATTVAVHAACSDMLAGLGDADGVGDAAREPVKVDLSSGSDGKPQIAAQPLFERIKAAVGAAAHDKALLAELRELGWDVVAQEIGADEADWARSELEALESAARLSWVASQAQNALDGRAPRGYWVAFDACDKSSLAEVATAETVVKLGEMAR